MARRNKAIASSEPPSSPSSPQNPRRSTRQESHGVTDNEGKADAQRVTRGQRAASADTDDNKPARRARGARGKPVADLAPVIEQTENDNVDPVLLGIDKENGVVQGEEEDGPTRQLREMSSTSAVTAQTSHSAQELAELDHELMLERIVQLDDTAQNVLDLIGSYDTTRGQTETLLEDIQDPKSKFSRNFQLKAGTFDLEKGTFGTGRFLNLSIFLRGLLDIKDAADIGDGPWRLDNVFYKANLAAMTITLIVAFSEVTSIPGIIDLLERDFQTLFFSEALDGHRGNRLGLGPTFYRSECLELAVEIRTQFLITLLGRYHTKSNFEPDALISQVFYDEDEALLKGWECRGLSTADLSDEDREFVLKRIHEIRAVLGLENDDTNVVINLEAVKEKYTILNFISMVLGWTQLRTGELKQFMTAQGGLKRVQRHLVEKINARTSQETESAKSGLPVNLEFEQSDISETAAQAVTQARLAAQNGTRRQYDSPSSIQHIKQRFNLLGQSGVPAQVRNAAPQIAPQANMIGPSTMPSRPRSSSRRTQKSAEGIPSTAPAKAGRASSLQPMVPVALRAEDDDNENGLIARDSTPRSDLVEIHQIYRASRAEQNKENVPERSQYMSRIQRSLLDQQAGATKIAFETQEDAGLGGLTAADDYMPDPSGDEGYQNDQREGFATSTPRPQKRRNAQATPNAEGSRKRGRVSSKFPRPPRNPPPATEEDFVSQPGTDMPQTQIDLYKQVNEKSKSMAASQPKPRNKKKFWTDEETYALIEYIETIGFSCAAIKDTDRKGPKILEDRDVVSLKDKARNMKVDYLRAGHQLPKHFEDIPLSKVLIERLRSAGVDTLE
ncbi:hypothetical protein MMC25_003167 [Agyrium rufum]|nr:hypothetical protein [Agyrium rufum]